MSNGIEWRPLTLAKHRDGRRYGTAVIATEIRGGDFVLDEFMVKVSSPDSGRHYYIDVVDRTADVVGRVYRPAGMIRKAGVGKWTHFVCDENGRNREQYTDKGTLAAAVHTIARDFVHDEQARKAKA